MKELPAGWTWATLGDISTLVRGVTFKKAESSTTGGPGVRPILRAGNIQAGKADLRRDLVWVPEDRVDASQLLRAGDIVVATSSGSLSVVGKSALIARDWSGAHGAFMTVVRPNALIHPGFLSFWVSSPSVRDRWSAAAAGTSINNLKTADLLTTPVPLAPRQEQDRVVLAIEEHLALLDAGEAAIESAHQRLQVLLDRVVDAAFADLTERAPVGDLADVRGGIQKQPRRRPKDNPSPFLRVANVGHGTMALEDVHEIELFDGELDRYRLLPGDLLVVEGNGSPDQIGRSAVWHGEIDDCVHQNHLIRVRPGARIDPEFLGLYWNAPSTRKQLSAISSSTSGLHTLSTAKVRQIKVPVVGLDRQTAVVEKLRGEMDAIAGLRNYLHLVQKREETLRRSILTGAFRGNLVPQIATEESAEYLLKTINATTAAQVSSRRKRKATTS